MPAQGPGNDNITGDRYTLDLAVEPDLGNLLQNLTVANKMLDDTEDKFRAISDIVGSMTQRLAQATRQSELLATQSQRIQTTYQSIASSSMALANIGAGAMGMQMGGGGMQLGFAGGGFGIPGQQAFGGMPGYMPAMGPAMVGTAIAGAQEDIPEFRPPPPAHVSRVPGIERVLAWEKVAGFGGPPGSGAGGVKGAVNKFKTGYAARTSRNPFTAFRQGASAGLGGASTAPTVAEAVEAGVTDMGVLDALAQGGGTALKAAGAAGLLESAGGAAGMLGGIGGAAAAAAPWVGAAYAGYKLWADSIAGSRRLTGITGGTGVFSGVGGGYLPMKGKSLMMGLLHPGINYGEIQEKTLGAGYTGSTLENAQDYMFEAYKRGLGDVVDQLDLYSEVVDKAGGSIGELTGAMDYMRVVAKNSNANLSALANNFKMNVEQFVSMGVSGGAATQAALLQSTAFANSPIGQLSPSVRNSGGYDLNNPLTMAGIANQMGVGYGQVGWEAALNPGVAGSLPAMAEDAIIDRLKTLGFREGMNQEEIIRHMKDTLGWPYQYAGQMLADQGIVLQGVDPSDTDGVITGIMAALSHSMGKQYTTQTKTAALQTWSGTDFQSLGRGGAFTLSGMDAAQHHLASYGFGDENGQTTAFEGIYENFMVNNMQSSPVIESLLKQGPDAVANTFVKGPDGKIIGNMQQFLEQKGEAGIRALSDPKSGYLIHTMTPPQQKALDQGVSLDKAIGTEWEQGWQLTANTKAEEHTEAVPGSGQEVRFNTAQFQQLLDGIAAIG